MKWGHGRRMTAQQFKTTPLAPLGWLGRRQETGGEDPPRDFADDPSPAELAALERKEAA